MEKDHCGIIAQITNVDKSTLSRIGKCLRSNDDVLEKMLCPFTYKERAIDCIDK